MIKVNDKVRYQGVECIVDEIYKSREGENLLILQIPNNEYKKVREIEVENISNKTITKEDFDRAVSDVLDPNNYSSLDEVTRTIVLASGKTICQFLRDDLFGDKDA